MNNKLRTKGYSFLSKIKELHKSEILKPNTFGGTHIKSMKNSGNEVLLSL